MRSMSPASTSPASDTAMHRALQIVRSTLWTVAFFSFFINLLALTGSVYILQVYDPVLASRSQAMLAAAMAPAAA